VRLIAKLAEQTNQGHNFVLEKWWVGRARARARGVGMGVDVGLVGIVDEFVASRTCVYLLAATGIAHFLRARRALVLV
jgi:hypothetical protein